MKGLLRKGAKVLLVLVVFSVLLIPASVARAGKEDIPRTFSINVISTAPVMEIQ